jgi:asparagine synthase (glutamine-hydrolysing)
MCGIFGYFNLKERRPDLLRLMANQQIHRGPDSEGFFVDDAFGMGIRRLSVIDLVTGNQPIHNEDKSIWVVCNGEIYNYCELNQFLRERGHTFYTKSDIECLVHLYEDFGLQFLQHLNGMFSIALYNANTKRLYLARDRLGIKPLYYHKSPNYFLFSSELRSLLATELVSNDLDWNSLSAFLDYLYISTPQTPFKQIAKLKAGHYLQIEMASNAPSVQEIPYWKLADYQPDPALNSEEAINTHLVYLLKDANRLQIRSDVPICAFLSGGIDSSAVVAFAAMESSKPLRTYHVNFKDASEKMDERRYARAVAARYGTIHSEVMVDREDLIRLIPQLIWHLEEPFADLASVPTYIISAMARQEVTVCLNGSGGDELFGGYSYYCYMSHLKEYFLSSINNTNLFDNLRLFLGNYNRTRVWLALFPNYIVQTLRDIPEDQGYFPRRDLMNNMMARDIYGYLQSNILFLLDKVTMAVSLEGRVPLLDHRFVEVAAHLPSRWKIKKHERKYIFKKMLENYLPYEVLYRRKEGFGAPLDHWLNVDTRELLARIIENGHLRKSGLLLLNGNSDFLRKLKSWDLWRAACLEIWYRVFLNPLESPQGISLRDLG